MRELRAAGEAAPTRNGWHWATQAADALLAIQHLITDATSVEAGVTDAALGLGSALSTSVKALRPGDDLGAAVAEQVQGGRQALHDLQEHAHRSGCLLLDHAAAQACRAAA